MTVQTPIICAPEEAKAEIDGLSLSTINIIAITALTPQRVLIIVEGS